MNLQAAQGFTEQNTAKQTETLYKNYYQNSPIMGKVKITDFAKLFSQE